MLGSFLKENTFVAQTLIKPSESVNATLQVNDIARTVSLAIHTNSKALNATLNELVQDSHGSIVSNYSFQREILTTFKPTTTGEYVLTISNQGPRSVSVDGIFGYIPIIGENNEVNLSPLGGIVAGVILVIIGNIALIVGIVIVIMDKKGKTRSLAG